MKLGFFDSGLGGLTILKAVSEALPEYDYIYYGDTENLPYGNKPESEIYELTRRGVEYLFSNDAILVIIACNTASAETLRRLQDEYLPGSSYPERKILGVIVPVIEELIASRVGRSLLIGTSRTISSGKYHLELGKRNITDSKVEAMATPKLVPLIEAGRVIKAGNTVNHILKEREGEVGGIILGCTHYTLIKDSIRAVWDGKIRVFSQDEIIPKKVREYLKDHPEIESKLSRSGTQTIFVTKERDAYARFRSSLLGE